MINYIFKHIKAKKLSRTELLTLAKMISDLANSYKMGDKFDHEEGGRYMICGFKLDGMRYCLINVDTGNRYTDKFTTNENISGEDLAILCDGDIDKFTLCE